MKKITTTISAIIILISVASAQKINNDIHCLLERKFAFVPLENYFKIMDPDVKTELNEDISCAFFTFKNDLLVKVNYRENKRTFCIDFYLHDPEIANAYLTDFYNYWGILPDIKEMKKNVPSNLELSKFKSTYTLSGQSKDGNYSLRAGWENSVLKEISIRKTDTPEHDKSLCENCEYDYVKYSFLDKDFDEPKLSETEQAKQNAFHNKISEVMISSCYDWTSAKEVEFGDFGKGTFKENLIYWTLQKSSNLNDLNQKFDEYVKMIKEYRSDYGILFTRDDLELNLPFTIVKDAYSFSYEIGAYSKDMPAIKNTSINLRIVSNANQYELLFVICNKVE
ncbi:MAG: hypothetical protein K9J13_00270 [Saprospiraceae bacterium]|nr:hypothetical protein [Saprospiraceae bacterium]